AAVLFRVMLRASASTLDIKTVSHFLRDMGQWGMPEEERAKPCSWIRDMFPNPFQPVIFDPQWRTQKALALANQIYTDRAFDRMPILADALEEAGCTNADILNHCRQPGEHVRGCWVVDLLLGKS